MFNYIIYKLCFNYKITKILITKNFLTGLFVFLLLCVKSPFCILDDSPLSGVSGAQVFSQAVARLLARGGVSRRPDVFHPHALQLVSFLFHGS